MPLIGSETEGASVNAAVASEIAVAWEAEALHTGTIEALHWKGLKAPATSITMALCAKGTKPGAVIAGSEGEKVTPGATGEITGLSAKVTKGEKYWLVLLFQGTEGGMKWKVASGGRKTWKTSTKHKKVSEITEAQWATEETKEEAGWWATGKEEEGGTGLLATNATLVTLAGTEKIGGVGATATKTKGIALSGTERLVGRGGLATHASAVQIGSTAKQSAFAALVTKSSVVVIGGIQTIRGAASSVRRRISMVVFDED